MLLHEASPETVQEWKGIFDTYKGRLHPNRKPGHEIMAYLTAHYPVKELNHVLLQMVAHDNIIENDCHARKLPPGEKPDVQIYSVENTGAARYLYENQVGIFKGIPITVGIDRVSGYFMVEGSDHLWDDLFAFRGLDEDDLNNMYLVAEYITCAKKFGILDQVLSGNE